MVHAGITSIKGVGTAQTASGCASTVRLGSGAGRDPARVWLRLGPSLLAGCLMGISPLASAGDASIDDLFGESMESAVESVETAPPEVEAPAVAEEPTGAGAAIDGAEDAAVSDLDALFVDDVPAAEPVPAVVTEPTLAEEPAPAAGAAEADPSLEDPASGLDDLFVDDFADDIVDEQGSAPAAAEEGAPAPAIAEAAPARPPIQFSGFVQQELGYIYSGDEHFNKFKQIGKFSARGVLADGVRWQAGLHLVFDPVFAFEDYFADRVEDNYQFYGWVDETYADFGRGNWEFRLGRQQIIWGETVGLFFADVVSALDLREFILPDFELIRIPQWAARAEYFAGDAYFDFIYIPVATVDRIGEPGEIENGRFMPGGDYYPYPPPAIGAGLRQPVFLDQDRPGVDFSTGGFGTRAALYKGGWDVSAFYYNSLDHAAAPERTVTATTLQYRPMHFRIQQFGSTLAKDFGSVVLKSEAVYTLDRRLPTQDLSDPDGLVKQNELRYVVGLDYVRGEHTFNAQFFQFWLPEHVAGLVPDALETGVSLFASTEALHPDVTPEVLWINSLNRDEWLLQAKITWDFAKDWRSVVGVDVFEGPQESLFGQYADRDRVYYELRYSF